MNSKKPPLIRAKSKKAICLRFLPGSAELNRQYAEDAVRRGAAAVLTDDEELSLSAPVVCRKDAPLLLGEINKTLFQPLPAVFAAVTGSQRQDFKRFVSETDMGFAGFEAASLGTLGIQTKNKIESYRHDNAEQRNYV